MKLFIGSDHAGFEMKSKLITFLRELNYDVVDKGAFKLDPDDDYPDFISEVAKSVGLDSKSKGIVIGGSGEGEAIDADRFPGVRAIVYYGGNLEIIKLSREHNDANILSLGARFLSQGEAEEAVRLWLQTAFSGDERHVRRIKKIDSLQNSSGSPQK